MYQLHWILPEPNYSPSSLLGYNKKCDHDFHYATCFCLVFLQTELSSYLTSFKEFRILRMSKNVSQPKPFAMGWQTVTMKIAYFSRVFGNTSRSCLESLIRIWECAVWILVFGRNLILFQGVLDLILLCIWVGFKIVDFII